LSTTAISERFGVCDRTAVDAINGTTWAHIQ
jgi:hypothetical protein